MLNLFFNTTAIASDATDESSRSNVIVILADDMKIGVTGMKVTQ